MTGGIVLTSAGGLAIVSGLIVYPFQDHNPEGWGTLLALGAVASVAGIVCTIKTSSQEHHR
jgi:drug/metabolite transporter (DMT)-like permease